MNKAAIYHVSYSNYAFPISKNTLQVRLKAARGDLKKVKIVYGPRFVFNDSEPFFTKEMNLKSRDKYNDYFATTITLNDPRFRYHFLLDDGKNKTWYNEQGFFNNRPRGYKSGFFQYSLISNHDLLDIPDWLDNAIIYQIFPERFCNGDSSLNPENCQSWGELPDRESFFGGDLKGIINKLDYLEDLGINTIYLTPIFKSPTNHKYNIDDYYQIDPCFGNKKVAKDLVDQAHQRGIKIILDAVFNHTGYNFFAFKDLRENGEKSRYKDWYIYQSLPLKTDPPVNYETFARNIPLLPKLNTANPEVQEYLLELTKYWMKTLKIDGWRLDVADEVDPSFWYRFRKLVKDINPQAYILGEVWHAGQKWLQGKQFDAVMNYSFTRSVIDFFGNNKIGPTELRDRLTKNRMNYKTHITESLVNLLDSHDTARFLHHCYDDTSSLKLAVLLQMTYPGVPMILYGDEIGLTGGEEPDSRRCMPWNKQNQNKELLNFYKQIIKIRKNHPPLQNGKYKTIIEDEARNIYGFSRIKQDNIIYIIINNSPIKCSIDLSEYIGETNHLQDLLTDTDYKRNDYASPMKIKVASKTGVILKQM